MIPRGPKGGAQRGTGRPGQTPNLGGSDLLQFEALDLAVQGAGGDTGRSNKKLTVSDALVVARSPQVMRGMYTNCILRNVRRIPTASTLYVGDTGQSGCRY